MDTNSLEGLPTGGEAEHQLARTQAAIMDALPANIALVDGKGVILTVNAGWRSFAATNSLTGSDAGMGLNYLDLCRQASGEWAEGAQAVAAGLARRTPAVQIR